MTTATKTRPIETLDQGAVRAAIWKNRGPNGAVYTVTFSHAYASRGMVRNSASFRQKHIDDLVKIAARAEQRLAALNRAAFERMAA